MVHIHIFCMFTYFNDGYNMNHIDGAVKRRDITYKFAERSFDIFLLAKGTKLTNYYRH